MNMFSRDNLVSIYDDLLTTNTLKQFNLPCSVYIDFTINDDEEAYGWCMEVDDDGLYEIELSNILNKTEDDLRATIAHELIHLHRLRCGDPYWYEHDPTFNISAHLITKEIGLDIK